MAGLVEGRRPPSSTLQSIASDLVALAAERGRGLLGWTLDAQRRDALVRLGARGIAAYPAQERFANRLLDRIRPRVVLAEEGCYGRMAVFNSVARDRGVRVAEYQHGMVTRNHDAYNVAPVLEASPAYKTTQPAGFLAYGPWWNGQFNTPVGEKVALGNPARTEALKSWSPSAVRERFVVLGDGIETAASLDRCIDLQAAVPAPIQVVFRPHPLERGSELLATRPEVALDEEPSLYASLASAHAVVGESSTALYEAFGLVSQVYAWDTPKSRFYLGDHPFTMLNEASLLDDVPLDGKQAEVAPTLWEADWRERLSAYLHE
jgi:hypothetical protein